MASYNTHSQHQHHQQQPAHHHSQQHTTGTHSLADVLNSASLAAGGSNTQQQHSQHPSHQHSPQQQHLHHHHHPTSHNQHHPPPSHSVSLHTNAAAAAAAQQHFERSSSTTTSATTTTFLVPVTSSALAPLDTATFLSAAASPHFVTSSPVTFNSPHHNNVGGGTSAASSTSSSYTFVQIKREPCQVSEVTTSNTNHHHHHHHHHQQSYGSLASAAGSLTAAAAAAAKTMSSSTLTTLVKIEASSPKVHDMDNKGHMTGAANMVNSSNNTVPIGIAVARKRPQETTAAPGPPSSLTSSSALPLSQQLNKDMNCFGIRVADLGGVGTGCGNFYFTGNGDLMTSSATADELALNAASLQSVNRASSTFWQYPNALPIESVISMSPATVGLQYSREASRGQVVLLPATATSLDPFQQAAAAFVWPSYIPQGTTPATLQPPPNFIFPSMSPHSTLQAAAAAQPYATSLQFLGSNYLTAAAAAAAAAAATSTLCQHNQQTNSTSSSINLSLGGCVVSGAASGTTMSSSSSTMTRFMSLATSGPPGINDTGQTKGSHGKTLAPAPGPPTLALATAPSLMSSSGSSHPPPVPPQPLLIPPSALKLEDWSGADFMAAASKTTTTTLTAAAIAEPPPPTQYDMREKHATNANATNLLELPAPTAQALNLMRLPTPPTSATIETATAAAVAASGTSQLPPLLFQSANSSPTPTLLNLSATLNRVTASNSSASSHSTPNVSASLTPSTHFLNASPANVSSLTANIGPPTPLGDDMALNFKSNLDGTPPQIVVGVPRAINPALPSIPPTQPPPQMQDVNIQTDTPVCSEDENSSCPLNQGQCGAVSNVEPCTTAQCTPPLTQNDELYHDAEAQQPLELTKTHRPPTSPQVESSSLQEEQEEEEEHNVKSPLRQVHIGNFGAAPEKLDESHSATPAIITSTSTGHSGQEDLTGLELLSNISTSSLLVKSGAIRVKQEPLDPVVDQNMCHALPAEQHAVMESNSYSPVHTQTCDQLNSVTLTADHYPPQLSPPPPHQPPTATHQSLSNLTQNEVEPLGGLKLLCALAEQRIQEEEEVQSTTLNATNGLFRPAPSESPHSFASSSFPQSSFVKPCPSSASTTFQLEAQNSTFPSLETLELPSTSGNCFSIHTNGGGSDALDIPVKRKKHKHSKSSKSSNSNGSSSKKSQKCGKKNKKKYSKEKKRHKLLAEAQQADLDFDDPQLQQELQNAFQNCADPNYQRMGGKWPTPQEIFSIMESSMRMRLADITRQYRKKKRKLDEISKNKKKKKCSKLQAAAQQLSLVGNSTLSLVATERPSATTTSSLTSSPLCDYKFGKFSSKSSTTSTSNYLAPSSFIRFATDSTKSQSHHLQTHPQFPPPPDLELENENTTSTASNTTTTAITTTPIYKPVRLEPSSLSAASAEQRSGSSSCNSGVLRLAQKHASSEKLSQVIVCKERRLGAGSGSTSSRRSSAEEDEEVAPATTNDNHHHNGRNGRRSMSTDNESANQQSAKTTATSTHKMSPIDRSLMLTQDHLFRKETRVLTDMGGLFYAGIMKPLQPPDVYAITLDGERGNKSHIMSREEIFNDTILEVAPKTVEDVPVGTRLCAYWSQQYRCLYPGRAIESESSDDGVTSQEFVSVEFDDGDSGRIRLQNIRYLLSDYPIVEYNDNPLYSLGKQKKANANKTPNNNDTDHHQHQHPHHESDDHSGSNSNGLDKRVTSNGSHRDYHQATAMEIFAAKRSEKKRNKSLKKKSQNACSANNATTNGTTNVSSSSLLAVNGGATPSANGSLESSECLRKHHKHKKRKKHKKHRKNLMEIGIVSEIERNTFSPSSSFNNKSERTTKETSSSAPQTATAASSQQHQQQAKEQQQHHLPEEEVYDEEPEEDTGDQENNTQTEDSQMAEDEEEEEDEDDENDLNLSHIKHETAPSTGNQHHSSNTASSAHSQQNFKVKTEHLEMEEESTSNLMSEISDEAKADDMIEHNSSKGSKIAAFLPDRQLWGWLGTAYCKFGTKGSKGRIRKQFYKTIKRGKETITVGDCAVFLSTGRPDRPYIGRIESMWENSCNNKIVRVRWFYHPEETTGCPKLKFPGALFESPHEDENDVQTISHRCEVLQFGRYFNKFGADSKQYQSIYDNNDTYYLAGFYNPRLQVLKLQDNIPTLEEQQQQPQHLLQLQHQTQEQQQNTTTATIINNNNTNNNTTITE